MKHSFITPGKKKLFGAELMWLLVTSGILVVIMVASTLFINSAISSNQEALALLKSKNIALEHKEKEVGEEIIRLEVLAKINEEISTKNRLKKENVKNFFDLVPDDVVLKKALFRDGTLRLSGSTKNIKHFKSGFERSLKSLFARSSTKFKRDGNGGYTFYNISILEVK